MHTTSDGGRTWTVVSGTELKLAYYSPSPAAVDDIVFVNRKMGFAYQPGLYLTVDGGRSWRPEGLPPVTALAVAGSYAYALTQGRPGGPVELWRSTLSSPHWSKLALPQEAQPSRTAQSQGVELGAEGSTVMLLRQGFFGPGPGSTGWIVVSHDRGGRWRSSASPCKRADGGAALVAMVPGRVNSWIVECFSNRQSSQERATHHRIYLSQDGGQSWSPLGVPIRRNGPAALDANASGSYFLATTGIFDVLVGSFDGGRTWRTLIRSGGSFYGWADLHFVNRTTGFVVAPTHYAPEHIFRTDDGGRKWRIVG